MASYSHSIAAMAKKFLGHLGWPMTKLSGKSQLVSQVVYGVKKTPAFMQGALTGTSNTAGWVLDLPIFGAPGR